MYAFLTTLNNMFIWSWGNCLLETHEGGQINDGVLETEEDVEINRPSDKSAYFENYFLYFSSKTYVVGTQKNRLNETVLLSTQNTRLN